MKISLRTTFFLISFLCITFYLIKSATNLEIRNYSSIQSVITNNRAWTKNCECVDGYSVKNVFSEDIICNNCKRNGEQVNLSKETIEDLNTAIEQDFTVVQLDNYGIELETINLLDKVNIIYLKQLLYSDFSKLKKIKGFGKKSRARLLHVLTNFRLNVRDFQKQFKENKC